jgi:hypothetical protein
MGIKGWVRGGGKTGQVHVPEGRVGAVERTSVVQEEVNQLVARCRVAEGARWVAQARVALAQH